MPLSEAQLTQLKTDQAAVTKHVTNTANKKLVAKVTADIDALVPDGVPLTITSAGRQGITPGDVAGTGNTFTNVDIVSSADDSIDFESDLKNVGDGTLTFTNLQSQKLINIIEPYAELTFANASAGRMVMGGNAADTVSYSGSFTCTRRAPIGACVLVTGGTLDLNATFSRIPGTNTPTTPYTLAKLPGVIVGAP